MIAALRSILRDRLDHLVEPRPTYDGRHSIGVPSNTEWVFEWVPELWAQERMTEIRAKHGLDKEAAK